MNNPKLSIITVCFNEKMIEATCQSVVNQKWRDFEWIVIDGGSTDGTVEILKKYKDNITVFISEKDAGIYNAMNKGISQAHGEYLIFMNGGDYFLDPYVLGRTFRDKKWEEDIIYGDALFLREDGTTLLREFDDDQTLEEDFFAYNCLAHQATFIRRSLFTQYGGYNERHRIVSDWEKWIEWIVVNKVTYKHHKMIVAIHNYTGISSHYTQDHLREREEVMRQYYPGKSIENPKQTLEHVTPMQAEYRYVNSCKLKLFGFISLMKIKRNLSNTKLKVYIFHSLLILKIFRY